MYNNNTQHEFHTLNVASLYHVEITLVLRANIVQITKVVIDLLQMWSQFLPPYIHTPHSLCVIL